MDALEKACQVAKRLNRAAIKKDKFKSLVEKLIGYNTAMEALLYRKGIDHLCMARQKNHMAMLQMNQKVEHLSQM